MQQSLRRKNFIPGKHLGLELFSARLVLQSKYNADLRSRRNVKLSGGTKQKVVKKIKGREAEKSPDSQTRLWSLDFTLPAVRNQQPQF